MHLSTLRFVALECLLFAALTFFGLLAGSWTLPVAIAAATPQPQHAQHVLAQSTFFGNGSQDNVNTHLFYEGRAVAPSFVNITPIMWKGTTTVSIWLHTTDPRIDVRVGQKGVPWEGMAWYIQ